MITSKQKHIRSAHRREARAGREWRKLPWWDKVARAGKAHLGTL